MSNLGSQKYPKMELYIGDVPSLVSCMFLSSVDCVEGLFVYV